jgi:guanylate kinase
LVIFDIDVQGHKIVRKKLNDIITSVFITTPSLKELEFRLNNRSTDSKEVIQKRIINAQEEIKSFLKYDYLIVNDNLNEASKQLVSIANAARVKSKLSSVNIIEDWLEA